MTKFDVLQQTIDDRAKLLLKLAQEVLDAGVIPKDEVFLAEHRFALLSEGYFLLNHAYKSWRIHDGHNTERPKIAALQAVVISRLQPFFPKKFPVDESVVAIVKCNEIFALTYAFGILEIDLVPDTPERLDLWLRILDIITDASAQTIEPFIADKKMQIERPLSEHASMNTVHDHDRLAINSLICIFELLSEKGKILRPT